MSENSKNEYFKKNDQDFYKNLLFWISQKKNVIFSLGSFERVYFLTHGLLDNDNIIMQ